MKTILAAPSAGTQRPVGDSLRLLACPFPGPCVSLRTGQQVFGSGQEAIFEWLVRSRDGAKQHPSWLACEHSQVARSAPARATTGRECSLHRSHAWALRSGTSLNRGYDGRLSHVSRYAVLRWVPGLVPLAQSARCTRPGHENGVSRTSDPGLDPGERRSGTQEPHDCERIIARCDSPGLRRAKLLTKC
jgi:hypothetical protein